MSDARHGLEAAEQAQARSRRPLFRPEVVRSRYEGDSGERAAAPPMIQPVALGALIISSLAGAVFLLTATHVETLAVPGRLVSGPDDSALAASPATGPEPLASEGMATEVDAGEPVVTPRLDVELELPPAAASAVRAGELVRVSYVPGPVGTAAVVFWAMPLIDGQPARTPSSLAPHRVRLRLDPGRGVAPWTYVPMSAGASVTGHLNVRRRSLLGWLVDVLSVEVK